MTFTKCYEIELAVLNYFLNQKKMKLLNENAKIVSKRELTGVGIITEFTRDETLKVGGDNEEYICSETFAYLNDDLNTGYLITVINGYIDFLECHTNGEPWPDKIIKFRLYTHDD